MFFNEISISIDSFVELYDLVFMNFKRIFFFLFVSIFVVGIFYYSKLLSYGISQLMGQINVIYHSEHYSDWIKKTEVSDNQKQKILLVQEIKKFAHDALGFKNTNNYSKVFDEKDKHAMLMLTASPEFSLKPISYDFPIIGSFDYIGYFDAEKAQKHQLELQKQGFDVDLSPVGGWSTLGWFSDPILSSALNRTETSLADLVIHELFHYTYFKTGNNQWNENHANFFGKKGAILFIKKQFPNDTLLVNNYLKSQERKKTIHRFLNRFAISLDSLYQSTEFLAFEISAKKSIKLQYYNSLIDQLSNDSIVMSDSLATENLALELLKSKNAFISSFLIYNNVQDSLEDELKNNFDNNLPLMIKAVIK
jgi:predicted aminopeptidase